MAKYLDDTAIRLAAFDWLAGLESIHGEYLPRNALKDGFALHGERIHVIQQQGIFKPKVLSSFPLSITTSPNNPYGDRMDNEDVILYHYQGNDPMRYDNVWLRNAMKNQVPLIYFYGIDSGVYTASWPVLVVDDNRTSKFFAIQVLDRAIINDYSTLSAKSLLLADGNNDGQRAYTTITAKKRMHQQRFRFKVLRAYQEQCALCRLRHAELLDAAHIIPDEEEGGEPVVSNGLSLCKLHHAAYDKFFLGITPDYRIELRQDVLEEEDGPMLRHGLKGLHGGRLIVPRVAKLKPSPERLEIRYEKFLAAS